MGNAKREFGALANDEKSVKGMDSLIKCSEQT